MYKKEYLLQKWILLLGRKLIVVSSDKGRHIKKGTGPLLLHLLKLLQKLFPLIRSYFSSSTKLPLNFNIITSLQWN
ncbi:transcription regulator NOT2/NOT3/NOT5 family protein [Trifolium repens]|nr:transcription regulator NOT2/NOT3/NOT5 family protein [Trifolium repens]